MESKLDHVLLIDVDPFIHDAVRMILEPAGYRITCCSTAPNGLELMRRDPPQLVLLDIMLATPSEGFHIAYEMRGDAKLRNIPIIVLSAVGQTTGMNFAGEIGSEYLPVERFIEKPFDAATLRDAVSQVLLHQEAHT